MISSHVITLKKVDLILKKKKLSQSWTNFEKNASWHWNTIKAAVYIFIFHHILTETMFFWYKIIFVTCFIIIWNCIQPVVGCCVNGVDVRRGVDVYIMYVCLGIWVIMCVFVCMYIFNSIMSISFLSFFLRMGMVHMSLFCFHGNRWVIVILSFFVFFYFAEKREKKLHAMHFLIERII